MTFLATSVCLAIRNQAPGLLDNPEALPMALQTLAGRELVCQTEYMVFWDRYVDHLCDELPWLLNAEPPYQTIREWGTVAITAWIDKMVTKHGPTQNVRPFDPARVPRCPIHNNPASWFG